MRLVGLLLLASARAPVALAQGAVATDLWRVATGTLAMPAALLTDATAAAWTPAVPLSPATRAQVGLDAVHAPSETGVQGALLVVGTQARGLGTLTFLYGRMGIGDIAFTETSPETLGDVPVWQQTASVGLSGRPRANVAAGVAVRFLSGRLGDLTQSQFGLDLGAQWSPWPVLRLGAATQFLDPTFGDASDAAALHLGAEARTDSLDAWGAPAVLALRYGSTIQHDEEAQHFLGAGVSLGHTLSLDGGAVREAVAGDAVWRGRLSLGLSMGGWRVLVSRDGGVNGFGATWRFGLAAAFR